MRFSCFVIPDLYKYKALRLSYENASLFAAFALVAFISGRNCHLVTQKNPAHLNVRVKFYAVSFCESQSDVAIYFFSGFDTTGLIRLPQSVTIIPACANM